MLTTLWEQYGEGPFLFKHYCALVHQASCIKTWLNKYGLEELDWPEQSPDLNLTEHLWDELKQGLRARSSYPTSMLDLTNTLLNEWANLPHTNTSKSSGKPSQKSGSFYCCKGGTNSTYIFLNRNTYLYLECHVIKLSVGVITRCPNTFIYIVHVKYTYIIFFILVSIFSSY